MTTTLSASSTTSPRPARRQRRCTPPASTGTRIEVRADSSELPAADEDRRDFFARLFGLGDDNDSSSHYGEAVRRGNAVVSEDHQSEPRILIKVPRAANLEGVSDCFYVQVAHTT